MAALCGCSGFQSALDPAGEESEKIATLFWVMTGGAGAIWLAVTSAQLMTKAAEGLSDDDIDALAHFFGKAAP